MKLNNSIKLAIANFALFWKIFVYKIIAFGLSILFVLPIFGVLKNVCVASGLSTLLGNMFSSSAFQSVTTLSNNVYQIFNAFFESIKLLASTNVIALIYLIILFFIIIPFLFKLSDVPASESAYSYISSLNKNSFAVNFISMLDKSMGYSILRALLEIPFVLILFGGVYGLLALGLTNAVMAIISPLLVFVFIILMCALNNSFFNGWAPSIVVFNVCAGKAFKKGIKSVNRNFFSILSSFSVVMTVCVALLYLFGIYAFIVTIPLLSLIYAVFGQVLFFESQGMDYYISPDKIITPKKLECTDRIQKIKYII